MVSYFRFVTNCNKRLVLFGTLLNLHYMANVNSKEQTHDQLQAACFKAAQQLYYPYLDQRLFCIPNDMYAGNIARWKQYEALGVTPGIWDMQLVWFEQTSVVGSPVIMQATHWFEFKVGADKLSKKQEQFQKRMQKIGHHFYIISEEDQFMNTIDYIIKPTLYIAKQIWQEEILTSGKKQ